MTDYVLTGLVKRRAQLSGEIEATHERLRKMVTDLEALDATILLFDPNYIVGGIKPKAFRPPKDWSNRGEMTRMVLGILRQASEPLTSRDIAMQMIADRALDPNDAKLLMLMVKRVGVCLRDKRTQGVVKSSQGPGQWMVWEIVR